MNKKQCAEANFLTGRWSLFFSDPLSSTSSFLYLELVNGKPLLCTLLLPHHSNS